MDFDPQIGREQAKTQARFDPDGSALQPGKWARSRLSLDQQGEAVPV